jgi:hypothetical protein
MKKIITICAALLLTASIFAQSPEKMSYQAVIRNPSNNLVTNTAVGMRISILQGSGTGAEVYKEIFNPNPQTNANGLVTIEIGSGIPLIGTFATIDWTSGPYFIKTETDPTGGTSYTITGTSQLLSVPYALHAKTAETVTGTITETDPTFTSSQAANITTADITNLGNLSGVNTGDQDGSETKVTAGTNITVTGSGTTVNPYVVNATGATTLTIGQAYQGGIIFWLDATGQHGLIAATSDQSTGIEWYNGTYSTTNALRDGIGAGLYNTERIIANQAAGSYAAQLCANYQGGGYGDWYLPSKYELNLLYLQKTVVGGFVNDYYWSSNEADLMDAWVQNFDNGYQTNFSKFITLWVRAVRAF